MKQFQNADEARTAVEHLPASIFVESYMENAQDNGLSEEANDDGLAFWTEIYNQAVNDNGLEWPNN